MRFKRSVVLVFVLTIIVVCCACSNNTVKKLISCGKSVKDSRVAILGLTFKENCPDTRNTKIVDIINELKEYGVQSYVTDAYAESEDAKKEYGIDLIPLKDLKEMEAVIIGVAHDKYFELTQFDIDAIFTSCDNSEKVLIDVKGILNRKDYESAGYCYWRL